MFEDENKYNNQNNSYGSNPSYGNQEDFGNNNNGVSGSNQPVNNTPAYDNNYTDNVDSNYSVNSGNNSYHNGAGFTPDYSTGGTAPQNTNTTQNVNSYEWGTTNQNPQSGYYHSYKQKPKKEKKSVSRGAIAIVLVVCILFSAILGIGGGVGTYLFMSKANRGDGSSLTINKSDSTGGSEKSSDGTVLSTEEVSNKVADSVVEIVTETVSYSYFYGQAISEGAGSGVVIDKDGYIVTNSHVIQNAKSIEVTLRNGNEYKAKLIGSDEDKDIALLKIEPKSSETLTVATFGDSSKLVVGDKAVAIGNPLGELGGTVTDGIISALDREVNVDNKTMNLLQTDAAINPGNSGGGLFDGQGNLIGIVVAKASGDSSTGSVEGLGFAIPINDVQDILSDLKEYGYVKGKPAEIGVTLQDYMDMVYVYSVSENSPADKAGLEEGDKIMKINDEKVESSSDVKKAVTNSKAGDKLVFEIERNGKTQKVTVTVQEASKNEEATSYQNSNEDYGDVFGDDDNSIWGNFGY